MFELAALRSLPADGRRILLARSVRMFGFGALAVILVLHFVGLGWDEARIGRMFALAMAGDAVVTLWVTVHADRLGRARMLGIGALLMLLAGAVLPLTSSVWVAGLVMFLGAVSLNGGEAGPFMAIEQAALTHCLRDGGLRTSAIVWYTLCGTMAAALGSLAAGWIGSYRTVFAVYAGCGVVLWIVFHGLSGEIEPAANESISGAMVTPRFGLHKSKGIVLRLSALFMVDTLGSGLVIQAFLAYWLQRRFGADTAVIGTVFSGMGLLAGFSAFAAGRLARRIGLINTMVWTHIPANLLLISLPWMPSLPLAVAVLMLRGCLSQMDVPARQSYLMAVVEPDERSAAGGVTGLAKSIASAMSPPVTGMLFAAGWMSAPFVAAGVMKIIYDLALWRGFRAIRPPEERA